jgi:hypothetical protein
MLANKSSDAKEFELVIFDWRPCIGDAKITQVLTRLMQKMRQ